MGDGGLQAKMLNGKYEPLLEFPEGWGGGGQIKKTLRGGSINIFWEQHITFNLTMKKWPGALLFLQK